MAIIIGIFSVQRHGTASVSKFFGPITIVWFLALASGGLYWIIKQPFVLNAFNPVYGIRFLFNHGFISFVVLGSVFLAVTGAEALYSDLGHFGRKPIQTAWLYFVFPCLALNYLGQGALLMSLPATLDNTFFLLYPEWALVPMVILQHWLPSLRRKPSLRVLTPLHGKPYNWIYPTYGNPPYV